VNTLVDIDSFSRDSSFVSDGMIRILLLIVLNDEKMEVPMMKSMTTESMTTKSMKKNSNNDNNHNDKTGSSNSQKNKAKH
jgi:hypothetical protein